MTKSKKLVCIWATASIIAALVIHGLFHLNAPNEWFIAAWSAGDILTYISTVTLGLLAVWQNGKIQKSNEESQARLEKISQEANKLNIVGKIIEHETARINKLESLFDEYQDYCNPSNVAKKALESATSSTNKLVGLVNFEQRLNFLYIRIGRELKENFQNRENPELKLELYFSKMFLITSEFLKKFRDDQIKSSDFDQKEIWEIYQSLFREKENYLSFLRARLDKVLYEDLTLEEVRILYKGKGGKPSNDQNETGNA